MGGARTARAARLAARLPPALCIATALVAVATWAPAARADVRTEARRHFRRGMELVQQGELDAGVAELTVAYDTLPHPNVLYNIARAYADAGRYDEALEYFERYLETDPPDRSEVVAFVEAIHERLGAARAPTPEATTPAAATEPAGPRASGEDLAALREAATQIEALAEATNSEALRERARVLRAMAASLEAAQTGSAGGAAPPGEGAEPAAATAAAPPALPEAPELEAPEEDLYQETVVSASRFAQDPLDAPSATYNITRQDIRLSGLPNIGEMVRRAPGVHAMATGPSDLQLGIRGFNLRISPSVLMLVNGRSVYLDPLGTIYYWNVPFGMDEIERIEVIRGPASALYGADAFSGIINVITRRPGDEPGTRVFAGYGNFEQIRAQVVHSGRKGIVGYRLSAGYDRSNRYTTYFPVDSVNRSSFFDDPDLGAEIVRASAAVRVQAAPRVSVDLEGGFTSAHGVTSARATLNDVYTSGPWSHLMATLNTDWGYLRTYWNFLDAVGNLDSGRLPADFEWHTIDVEGAFSRAFHLVWDHNLTLGAAYRKKLIDWNYLGPDPFDENHYAAFFQDTMDFGEHVSFVASLRMDGHPLLEDLQFSPRGALVLRPTEQTAIRLSAGRAFRTQTFLESYLDLRMPSPIAGVAAQGYGAERNEDLFDAPNLRPEQIVSTELGFRYVGTDYFDVDLAAYYNRVTDLVRYHPVKPFTLDQVAGGLGGYDENTGAYLAGYITLGNEQNEYDVFGGEATFRVYPVTGLDVYANYAYNHALVSGPVHRPSLAVGPRHLYNVGAQYRSSFGLDLSADFHYVGKQIWQEQVADATVGVAEVDLPLSAYYFVNARLGTRLFEDTLDLGVVAQNLTNNRHYEHPLTQRIPLRIVGTVAYRF